MVSRLVKSHGAILSGRFRFSPPAVACAPTQLLAITQSDTMTLPIQAADTGPRLDVRDRLGQLSRISLNSDAELSISKLKRTRT